MGEKLPEQKGICVKVEKGRGARRGTVFAKGGSRDFRKGCRKREVCRLAGGQHRESKEGEHWDLRQEFAWVRRRGLGGGRSRGSMRGGGRPSILKGKGR